MTTDEAMQVAAADAVEIYNHSCVVTSARGSGISIADYLLNEVNSFTATDDSHFELPDWGGGWVMVAQNYHKYARRGVESWPSLRLHRS